MAERVDFSIRNSIPSKNSYLHLYSVVSANFGTDRALMGNSDHRGEVVMVTDTLAREKDYLVRIQCENNNPDIPFILEVSDESRSTIFKQSALATSTKLNIIMKLPQGMQQSLRLSFHYDYDNPHYKELPKKGALGDFMFISATIEAL